MTFKRSDVQYAGRLLSVYFAGSQPRTLFVYSVSVDSQVLYRLQQYRSHVLTSSQFVQPVSHSWGSQLNPQPAAAKSDDWDPLIKKPGDSGVTSTAWSCKK